MTKQTAPRTWMITGTSSGFGSALAKAALADGERVIATARDPRKAPPSGAADHFHKSPPSDAADHFYKGLDALVRKAPDRVAAIRLDVTKPDEITAAVAAGVERFGRIDVLVNNAGYGSVGAMEEIDVPELERLHATMFLGPVRLMQAVLPHMREQRGGTIVQISSMGGQLAPPGFGAYCSAKFALEAMSESLAAEVRPLGIRVLIVEPGAFRTEFGASRMHRSRTMIADYAATVGPTRAVVDRMDGSQPGGPDRAAAAILSVIDADDPPLRLALGDDAVDAIRAKHDQLRVDLDGWEHISRSTASVGRSP